MPQSWDMGQILSLPLRRKACWGFFSCTEKIQRLRRANPRTRVPESSMLTTWPPLCVTFDLYVLMDSKHHCTTTITISTTPIHFAYSPLLLINKNVKRFILSHDTKALSWNKVRLYSVFSLRPGWGVGSQRHVPAALPLRKIPGFYCMWQNIDACKMSLFVVRSENFPYGQSFKCRRE
jgi:hypothetical protein